jgi:hypothetical protein
MNNAFKTTFVKMLLDFRGRIVSAITGVIAGAAANVLAGKIELSPNDKETITLFAGFMAMWFFDSMVIHFQTEGVRDIQDALPPNVKSDGVPGDVTVAAVKRAVSDHQES